MNAHGYQYNLASQRTLLGRTNSAVASWNGYVNALYDPAGQLTHAWTYLPDGTPVTGVQWSYGYDAAQNLSKRTNNTTVETFTVNALNQLTAVPDSTPSYDRRGNLTQRYFPAGPQYYWTYTYDAENQLASVATDPYYTYDTYRFKVEFTYDGQGRLRVKKDYTWASGIWNLASETRYVYDGMLIVQERNGSNTPTVTYTRGRDLSGSYAGTGGIGGLLARSHGYSGGSWSTHNFYHADGNGNVTALVNSAGTLQASYKYDPYGRYLSQSGALASANVLRFSSKPWVGFNGSPTAGLYYYGYRFYDPYLQRWVNRDPAGENASLNLHAFNINDPISFVDPFGLMTTDRWDYPPPPYKPPCYSRAEVDMAARIAISGLLLRLRQLQALDDNNIDEWKRLQQRFKPVGRMGETYGISRPIDDWENSLTSYALFFSAWPNAMYAGLSGDSLDVMKATTMSELIRQIAFLEWLANVQIK